ncbi:GNAT family N-acetyltransferase [Streptomyces sp. NPDC001904]|uniref:GNAT family N-acetyltransferase n=1 Tax=Streptomyces sp. NPDC001904 TaxID=3154531 RepID=UPI003331D753
MLDGEAATGLPYAASSDAARTAWREQYRSWLTSRLATESPVRVAVVDGPGRLSACALAIVDQRAPSPACPSGKAAWFQSVVTDPRDRGLGLGTAVLEHLASWLRERGVDEAVLQTTAEAEGFYQRAGYLPSGEQLLFRPLHDTKKEHLV